MQRGRKWLAAFLAVSILSGLLAGCGKGSESAGIKEKAKSAQMPTQAQTEQAIPENTEPIVVTDAVTLAKASLQKIDRTAPWKGSINNDIKFDGIIGLPGGEYYAEIGYSTFLLCDGESWRATRYFSTTIGKTYKSVNEEFRIIDGKQYYKDQTHDKVFTVGTGVDRIQPAEIPCVTVLEQVAAGTLDAQYSASPEEGHSLSLSLSGNDLKQFLSNIMVEFVADIPASADWSSLTAQIHITFDAYHCRPDDITIVCPELLSLYATTAAGAMYMNVEASEIAVDIFFNNSMYEDPDLALAVPGDIPAPTTLRDLIAIAAQDAGSPLGPVKSDNSQAASDPAPQDPETPVPGSDSTEPASDGFVPPETFEVIDTSDDITLYWEEDGSHVTISYPSGTTKLYDNCKFHQGGTYYAMIVHDLFVAPGQTKFTLMDVGDKDSYLEKKRDSYRKLISAEENLLSSEIGEIQTVTVNGMEVSYFAGSYEVINLLGKQVTSIDYYAVAEVGGSFLCLEFNVYPSTSYPQLDFSPVELLYGCVKP